MRYTLRCFFPFCKEEPSHWTQGARNTSWYSLWKLISNCIVLNNTYSERTNCHNRLYVQIKMLLECTQIAIVLQIILKFILQQHISDIIFTCRFTIHGMVLRSIIWMVLVLLKIADEIRTFFQILRSKESKWNL